MIRLKDTKHQSTSSFLADAIRIAEYYGFRQLESLPKDTAGLSKRPLLPLGEVEQAVSIARRDERSLLSSARKCIACYARSSEAGATLAWRVSGVQGGGMPTLSLELHVIGPSTPMSEALLMVVGNAIAEEAGIAERTLSLNNIGSAESSSRFLRDVGVYLRKHIETISPTLRPRAASDPLGTLIQLIEKGHPAAPRAPQPMEYLSEEERRRFWELLEYLEMFGLPYELSGQILGSRDLWSHTLFEISTTDSESGTKIPFAVGGRYDPLASRFSRIPTPAVSLTLSCEIRGKTRIKREPQHKAEGVQPAIFFAHLGMEARRRILSVLETLRRAGIRVHHGIWHERIGEQMMQARALATPYILILGHKEAIEGTVLVREVATNSQDAIPLPELPNYLKRRRLGISREAAV